MYQHACVNVNIILMSCFILECTQLPLARISAVKTEQIGKISAFGSHSCSRPGVICSAKVKGVESAREHERERRRRKRAGVDRREDN